MNTFYDLVVVGAGPAGSASAITAARAGAKVALIERGIYPGAKNVYGGVMYLGVLDKIVPSWREEIPYERWITKRETMVLDNSSSVTVTYHDESWGEPPYNGVTCLRSKFDSWLASKAQLLGVDLITSTTVSDIQFHNGSVKRVALKDTPDIVECKSVVLAEGALSLLSDRLGLSSPHKNNHLTLGVKEVLKLDAEIINERFNVSYDHGVDIEILGGLSPLAGGAFLYTNKDTLSIGVIVTLNTLKHHKIRPEFALEQIKAHPSIEPLIKGSKRTEYLAHLIPEGGWKDRGVLMRKGIYVAGEAASSTLAAGIWLEGVNYAIQMGIVAGEQAASYAKDENPSRSPLEYQNAIEGSFVGKNLKKLQHAPDLVLSDFVQRSLPLILNKSAKNILTVKDPLPKEGGIKAISNAIKDARVDKTTVLKAFLKTLWSFR